MIDDVEKFVAQFPLASTDAIEPNTIRADLDQELFQLLRVIGYNERFIHMDVELEIPEDCYEPSDVKFGSTITYPIYVAESSQSPPYLVGVGEYIMASSPFSGSTDYAIYQSMRVIHETAEPEMTVYLTPYDLLVFDGTGSPFEQGVGSPIVYYPLHDTEPESGLSSDMMVDLEPPEELR